MSNHDVKAGRWLAVLGAKFAWVLPFRTSLVVLVTLFSQIAHMLAFLLPLKIVILLGSDGVPRYFPPSFAKFDRDLLVVILGVATVGFFVAHTLAEKLIDWVTKSAAHLLVERNKKLVLFENQDQVAEGAYQGFARALAGLIFCSLALIALAWVYPEMAIVMSGYLAVVTFLVLGLCSYSERAREWINTNLSVLLDNLSAVGFFCVFGYLVVDFVVFQPPGILVAILSILAGRQSFGRVGAAVKGLYRLYNQREKLDAIFFHGRPLLKVVADKPGSFWQHLTPGQRSNWVEPLLREFCDVDTPDLEEIDRALEWQQPTYPNIGVFLYRAQDAVWMVKLFGQKKGSASQHEATLLADAPHGLPAPDFQGSSQYDAFPCGVYRLEPGKTLSAHHHASARFHIYSQLLSVELTKPFVRRYLRSMSTLPHRMSYSWLDRLVVAVITPEQKESLEKLRIHWQELCDFLSALPLVIYNPSLKPGSLWQAEASGSLCVLFWERWSLEPAGAGWPTGRKALAKLHEAHQEACKHRKSMRHFPSEHLMLSALAFELEQHVKNQKLDMAVETSRHLWKTLESFVVQETPDNDLDSQSC
ncbi:hypothetical protein [Chromohalobacter israelensis]|uniref:hypothetical protein n=1 Tax=Chromohalobacter israelensis TaxID=141390 RepID=UPI00265C7A31|nr:hypothetical protein [Chromohalobacter salexigens]MDO0946709.1 hypothetical protein [Chromohalobacter salexigens]